VALSGYATKDDVRQSLEAGFAVHLAKPVTLDMLESAIRQVTCPPMAVPTPLGG
jgi:CheY-like chemotaxis protein